MLDKEACTVPQSAIRKRKFTRAYNKVKNISGQFDAPAKLPQI
jgi:hypothetical protein